MLRRAQCFVCAAACRVTITNIRVLFITYANGSQCTGSVISGICDFVGLCVCPRSKRTTKVTFKLTSYHWYSCRLIGHT